MPSATNILTMKVSFYSGLWRIYNEQSPQAAVEFMKKNGFTHCEPIDTIDRCFFRTVSEAKEFKMLLDEAGIGCNCLSMAVDMYPDAETAVSALKHKAEITAALGAKYLHHTVYMGLTRDESSPDIDELFDAILPYEVEVVRYAHSIGVDVIFEPQGKYVNGMDGFTKFFERLKAMPGCESIGVCFDNGNLAFGSCDPYEFLKKFLPYVRNVHIKDYAYVDGSIEGKPVVYIHDNGRYFEDVPIGQGMMRVKECIELLKSSGYSGPYSLESNLINYGIGEDVSNVDAKNFVESI